MKLMLAFGKSFTKWFALAFAGWLFKQTFDALVSPFAEKWLHRVNAHSRNIAQEMGLAYDVQNA